MCVSSKIFLPDNFSISGVAALQSILRFSKIIHVFHLVYVYFHSFLICFSTSTAAVQFQIVHFKKSACLINFDLISFEVLRIEIRKKKNSHCWVVSLILWNFYTVLRQ